MKSALPKVLHPIAGLPMVAHVVRAAVAAGAGDVALVVGKGAEAVGAAVERHAAGTKSFVQAERREIDDGEKDQERFDEAHGR